MGKTNRLAGNERKIALLIGEQRDLTRKLEKAEGIIASIAEMRTRLEEIGELIALGETWIKDDHPEWTGDHLRPRVPFIHKNLIRFGQGTRLALAIVRESYSPMTSREIAEEAIRREGHEEFSDSDLDTATVTVSNGLKSLQKRGAPIAHDGGFPRRWFSTLES